VTDRTPSSERIDREPGRWDRFCNATLGPMLLFLGAFPVGIIGYGVWWAAEAVGVGITRLLS